ncbi:MAG: hypothetical protein AB1742_04165 [bacterium]
MSATKSRLRRLAAITLLFLLFQPPPLLAATPQKINYQGYLKSGGVPVDVATNFVFKVCGDAGCLVTYCTETANSVTVTKGRFNWLIGTAGCNLTAVPWASGPLYLQITVNGTVLSPSEEIVSAPYALDMDGTTEVAFLLDRDNTGAGVNSRVAFQRGTSNASDAMITWDEAVDEFILTSDGTNFATITVGTVLSDNFASATTYYGDGSNLTGISANDTTKVLKTGDTMTGALIISQGGATSSVSIYQSGTTDPAAYVSVTGAGNAQPSLVVGHQGTGKLIQAWTGAGDRFIVDNSGNIYASGTLTLTNDNLVNTTGDTMTGALYVSQGAATSSVSVYQSGTTDPAAYVAVTGAANAQPSLVVGHQGTGKLIQAWTGAGDRFIVDNSGNIYASGTLNLTSYATATTYYGDGSNLTGISSNDATKVLKTGDSMTGPLYIGFDTATATLHLKNAGGGNALYIDNIGNTVATASVYITTNNTNSSSYALRVNHSGAGDTISSYTDGTGRGGYFQIANVSSGSDAVYGTTNGTGTVYFGNHTGASGNLVVLQSGGVDKFVVDNGGVITKSGCPANTNDNGGTWRWCVDNAPRAAATFVTPVTTCANAGGMLCNYGEWIAACMANAFTYTQFEVHWVNGDFGNGAALTMTSDGVTCNVGTLGSGNDLWTVSHTYLCCFPK